MVNNCSARAQALLIGLTLLTLSVFNKPASFLQPADPVFLLGDEAALRELVQKGTRYSMVVNGLIEGGARIHPMANVSAGI